ncbi:PREDICTED: uncharacterized protein KIAA2013 homolog [Ceratosolen solmsi marchali]|uniref:Uncharacterized protein KIAA2013 homolog n=1 Tax=Ceratosolen solmsi marchali TaxID=326594 RepID=A0AAJ6YGU7_9HYME|nr:PREDICTED: uncharacterized protein KIAA2013 homolog [Ceratosolen solmsi marchali]
MRGSGGMFDVHEFGKRMRRFIDGNYSYRKILVFAVIVGGFVLYVGPSLVQWLFSGSGESIEAYEERCINEKLAGFYFDSVEYNANILFHPAKEDQRLYLPYVGNGIFGIPIQSQSWLYIKNGRSLSLPVKWQPLIIYQVSEDTLYREATITHYTKGIVYKYQCFRDGYHTSYQYYAHRDLEGIFVQAIKISNPLSISLELPFKSQASLHWSESLVEPINILVERANHEFNLESGYVPVPNSNKIVAVTIVYQIVQKRIQVKARGSVKMEFLTSIKYSEPIEMEQYTRERNAIREKAIDHMRKALVKQRSQGLKESHVIAWQRYWHTGFRISDSKAKGAINGYKINSTIYYVLSQVPKATGDVEKSVINNEGCYRGHHTLDAPRLWRDTSTIDMINELVRAWSITLEKQGCYRLMTGNPSAVLQAIVLSLGGLRFSNQHLEFNIDPQHLHRDFLFRRISYGNVTHLNISVNVNEDNRAVLGVAIDRSDSVYFGCDAGCLDAPVPLSQAYTSFPVKLTKPLTAILYITSDYHHMQDLQNALHVHAVDEAPAHDHHVMALHKHGHQLGGLPTFFWVSICFLIIVFHLFLCKLIVSEYWDQKDRGKVRYSKL